MRASGLDSPFENQPGRCGWRPSRRPPIVQRSFTRAPWSSRHTDAVTTKELQGWHPDPFALHEMRYFSAGRPTKLVRDGRVEVYDEPPEDWSPVEAASNAQVMPAMAAAALSDPAAPTRVFSAIQPSPAPAPAVAAAQSPYVQRRRRWMEYAFVAAGAVVAVLVFVALGGGSGKPAIAPAAFVTSAAQRTLAQNGADVTVLGTMNLAGQSLTIGGHGEVDFSTGAMSLTAGASLPNGSLTEQEIQVGGNLYLNVSNNGQSIAAATGGRHWLEIPIAQSGAQGLMNGSPASSLALLSQKGAKVTSLGTSSIGSQTCSGYAVTPSRQAMIAAARQESAKLGLPTSVTSVALQMVQAMAPPTISVWFDPSRQLACKVSVYMHFGTSASASSSGAQMAMTFAHYGAPVKITAPAASDTISVQQLLKAGHH